MARCSAADAAPAESLRQGLTVLAYQWFTVRVIGVQQSTLATVPGGCPTF